jgi:hypothetical protein|tara:strand:- start:46 stop:171 length:126 start_codon:yes stop_codon:yes gene_type:complete
MKKNKKLNCDNHDLLVRKDFWLSMGLYAGIIIALLTLADKF